MKHNRTSREEFEPLELKIMDAMFQLRSQGKEEVSVAEIKRAINREHEIQEGDEDLIFTLTDQADSLRLQ
jgi:hypothetical protein